MKTIRIIDAGTYHRVREYKVDDQCAVEELYDMDPDKEEIDLEGDYYEVEEIK